MRTVSFEKLGSGIAVVTLLALLSGCVTATQVSDLSQGQTGWVSYRPAVEELNLMAEILLPASRPGPVPAMIIVHGSG